MRSGLLVLFRSFSQGYSVTAPRALDLAMRSRAVPWRRKRNSLPSSSHRSKVQCKRNKAQRITRDRHLLLRSPSPKLRQRLHGLLLVLAVVLRILPSTTLVHQLIGWREQVVSLQAKLEGHHQIRLLLLRLCKKQQLPKALRSSNHRTGVAILSVVPTDNHPFTPVCLHLQCDENGLHVPTCGSIVQTVT